MHRGYHGYEVIPPGSGLKALLKGWVEETTVVKNRLRKLHIDDALLALNVANWSTADLKQFEDYLKAYIKKYPESLYAANHYRWHEDIMVAAKVMAHCSFLRDVYLHFPAIVPIILHVYAIARIEMEMRRGFNLQEYVQSYRVPSAEIVEQRLEWRTGTVWDVCEEGLPPQYPMWESGPEGEAEDQEQSVSSISSSVSQSEDEEAEERREEQQDDVDKEIKRLRENLDNAFKKIKEACELLETGCDASSSSSTQRRSDATQLSLSALNLDDLGGSDPFVESEQSDKTSDSSDTLPIPDSSEPAPKRIRDSSSSTPETPLISPRSKPRRVQKKRRVTRAPNPTDELPVPYLEEERFYEGVTNIIIPPPPTQPPSADTLSAEVDMPYIGWRNEIDAADPDDSYMADFGTARPRYPYGNEF
ncbi:hypothetical protein M426DRAFT_25959 [Hypoxylon sp. CI-4A]|nr:hypothetical protein M426DRAFT_25959 [Hypoxylon sp. CI-4A]